MRVRTYLALCAVACAAPLALVVSALPARWQEAAAANDMLLALAGTFAASLLTYPAGAVATVLSYIPVHFGVLTPTEAVLFAAPFHIAAGHLQWYVLVPKHFTR